MRILSTLLLLLFAATVFAQLPKYYQEERSNEGSILLLQFTYGGHVSAGDLADRYGVHNSVGGNFEYVTSKDYIIGLQSNFIFGMKVKEDVIAPLYNSEGLLFGDNGAIAEIQLRMRGLYVGANLGKMFRLKPSSRSGIRATIGAGYYQHKVRIQDDPQVFVPFLNDEYKKGYDRYTNGLALTQFIGYQHLGSNRRINFLAGFEFSEGFTKNRRSFNYDTRVTDTSSRIDVSIGFKVGWTLPLYVGENADAIQY